MNRLSALRAADIPTCEACGKPYPEDFPLIVGATWAPEVAVLALCHADALKIWRNWPVRK